MCFVSVGCWSWICAGMWGQNRNCDLVRKGFADSCEGSDLNGSECIGSCTSTECSSFSKSSSEGIIPRCDIRKHVSQCGSPITLQRRRALKALRRAGFRAMESRRSTISIVLKVLSPEEKQQCHDEYIRNMLTLRDDIAEVTSALEHRSSTLLRMHGQLVHASDNTGFADYDPESPSLNLMPRLLVLLRQLKQEDGIQSRRWKSMRSWSRQCNASRKWSVLWTPEDEAEKTHSTEAATASEQALWALEKAIGAASAAGEALALYRNTYHFLHFSAHPTTFACSL